MCYSQLDLQNAFKGVSFFNAIGIDFGVDNTLLDYMLIDGYGCRVVRPLVMTFYDYSSKTISKDDLNKLASLCKSYRKKYWDKLKEVENTEIDVVNPYNINRTITEETGGTTRNEKNGETGTSVYGFNSSSNVPKDVENESSTETGSNTGTRTETEVVKGNNTNIDVIARLNESLNFREIGYIEKVVKSVGEWLTCPVYP